MPYALMVAGVSFVIAVILGKPLINYLKRWRVGKQISLDSPISHAIKAGTPTMGGILIFLPVFITTIPFNLVGRPSMMLPLGTMVGSGVLGLIDDLLNLVGGKNRGVTAQFKLAWLLVISIVVAIFLHYGLLLRSVYVPFVGKFDIDLLYIPIAIITIVGFSNAVNLTDGLDTLAGGTAALAFAAYGVIAFLQEQAYLVTFSFTVAGATLGFLWHNAHPARVFMGDTGSLALGATLAVVALMTGHWLLLPVVGFVFVIEASSVIMQVIYFKATKGKRLFKMTPLHHHFELVGWSEPQITMRFWLIGMVSAMLGIALALS